MEISILVQNCNSGQTLDKASVSKNWTTDVKGVVPERKKEETKPYFPNCDRALKTKQNAMALLDRGNRLEVGL